MSDRGRRQWPGIRERRRAREAAREARLLRALDARPIADPRAGEPSQKRGFSTEAIALEYLETIEGLARQAAAHRPHRRR